MKKTLPTDAQVILVMMQIQNKIAEILGTDEKEDEKISQDSKNVDLLTYYIVKMVMLLKGLTKKSRESFTFIDTFKCKVVADSLGTCFPMISNYEIVSFARTLATDEACAVLKKQYGLCISKSDKYETH